MMDDGQWIMYDADDDYDDDVDEDDDDRGGGGGGKWVEMAVYI